MAVQCKKYNGTPDEEHWYIDICSERVYLGCCMIEGALFKTEFNSVNPHKLSLKKSILILNSLNQIQVLLCHFHFMQFCEILVYATIFYCCDLNWTKDQDI